MERTILAMSIKRCKSLHGHCVVLTTIICSLYGKDHFGNVDKKMQVIAWSLRGTYYSPLAPQYVDNKFKLYLHPNHGHSQNFINTIFLLSYSPDRTRGCSLFVLTDDQERQIDFAALRKEHPAWP